MNKRVKQIIANLISLKEHFRRWDIRKLSHRLSPWFRHLSRHWDIRRLSRWFNRLYHRWADRGFNQLSIRSDGHWYKRLYKRLSQGTIMNKTRLTQAKKQANQNIQKALHHIKDPIKNDEEPALDYTHNAKKSLSYSAPKSLTLTLGLILLVIISILLWAALTTIEAVTDTEGKVVSVQHSKTVKSLTDGTVGKIYAKEGKIINKGDILFVLDHAKEKVAFEKLTERQAILQTTILRLNAQLNLDEKLSTDPKDEKRFPNIQRSAQMLLKAKLMQYHSSVQAQERQINLIKKQLRTVTVMVNDGVMAQNEKYLLQRDLYNLEEKLNSTQNDFYTNTLAEKSQLVFELSRINQQLHQEKIILDQKTIIAPSKGYVNTLMVHNKGQIISRLTPLAEIVPLTSGLIIESKVLPEKIGFISIGQKAIITINTYDSGIYGSISGTVTNVSRDTIVSPDGLEHYKLTIKTETEFLKRHHKKYLIKPGMTLNAKIVTHRSSILSLLLGPITKAMNTALRE